MDDRLLRRIGAAGTPLILTVLLMPCVSDAELTVDLFHKNMPPSLETLERVDSVLAVFEDAVRVSYHLITDPAEAELISAHGLPQTHFPFAVVVGGSFSAELEGRRVDFVHFPLLMHGIGRHEGNWSLEDLAAVLADPSLMLEESTLPDIEEGEACPDE